MCAMTVGGEHSSTWTFGLIIVLNSKDKRWLARIADHFQDLKRLTVLVLVLVLVPALALALALASAS